MPEAIITNIIIGTVGIVGVGGSLLASYLQARSSRNDTKMQIEARQEEQAKQLEFENNQNVINRRIEERKKWIEPLRQSLIYYSESANSAYDILIDLGEFPEDFERASDVIQDPEYRKLSKITENWEQSRKILSNSIAQIGDPDLNKIINELIKIPLMVASSQIINEEKYSGLIIRVETAKNYVVEAFKRIEGLLSGGCE